MFGKTVKGFYCYSKYVQCDPWRFIYTYVIILGITL